MTTLKTRQADSVYLIGVKDLEPLTRKNQLPTTKEVLLRFHFFLSEKKSVRNASHSTIEEVNEAWSKALIPTKYTKDSIEKLESVHSQWLLLKKNKGRKTEKQKTNEQSFVDNIQKLFDIAHSDALTLMKIQQDKDFLIDQRTERKMIISSQDKEYIKKQERAVERFEKEEERRKRSVSATKFTSSSINPPDDDLNDTSSAKSSSENGSDDDFYQPSTSSKKKLEKVLIGKSKYVSEPKAQKNLFDMNVAGALDRNKVSDRKAVRLIIPIAAALGHDPAALPLSRSSIKRKREAVRQNFSTEMKSNLDIKEPIVVHWDSKILPDILGSQKVDRLPVLVSYAGGNVKLLGVPKLSSATGSETGDAVLKTLKTWDLDDKVIGMGFDTTAVNTGVKSGACTSIENKLNKELLWLPCRHHIMEIILSKVFTLCLGPSSSPEIQILKRLKESWNAVLKSDYTPLNFSPGEAELKNSATESLLQHLSKKDQPRDD